ncbi:hypothetical protein SVIOM74S_04783 [Streptomyces violarus]
MLQLGDHAPGQTAPPVGGVGPDPLQLGRGQVVPAECAARDGFAAFQEQQEQTAVRFGELVVGIAGDLGVRVPAVAAGVLVAEFEQQRFDAGVRDGDVNECQFRCGRHPFTAVRFCVPRAARSASRLATSSRTIGITYRPKSMASPSRS